MAYQIYVPNKAISAEVQKKLFKLGYEWGGLPDEDRRCVFSPQASYPLVFKVGKYTPDRFVWDYPDDDMRGYTPLTIEDLWRGKLPAYKPEPPREFRSHNSYDQGENDDKGWGAELVIDGKRYSEATVREALRQHAPNA